MQQRLSRPSPPRVTVAGARLVQAPTNALLAGFYCAQVAPPLLCGLFGPVPQASDLLFRFDLDLDLANTSAVAMPAAEVLAAFTVYPNASGQQNLGAACLTLCADPAQCVQNAPGACHSDQADIRGVDDFVRASAGFLVAVAQGHDRLENLRVQTIPANGQIRAVVHLELGGAQVLGLIRALSTEAIGQVQRGQLPRFAIPYRVEGTVWVNVEHFGRIAATIPAFESTWILQ